MQPRKLEKFLNILRDNVPTKPFHLDTMGIPYKEIGSGSFRETFWLKGYHAVIKFPMSDTGLSFRDDESCLAHAQHEIEAFERIRNSRTAIKEFLPVIYYQDYDNGVIVMERYKTNWQSASNTERSLVISKQAYAIGEKIRKYFRIPELHSDYSGDNLGLDKQGNFHIVDLGVC